ncbi:hypothetical protein GGI43DRAFT_163895 [Trichoderma evansii]
MDTKITASAEILERRTHDSTAFYSTSAREAAFMWINLRAFVSPKTLGAILAQLGTLSGTITIPISPRCPWRASSSHRDDYYLSRPRFTNQSGVAFPFFLLPPVLRGACLAPRASRESRGTHPLVSLSLPHSASSSCLFVD